MSYDLSILDQSPVLEGQSNVEALQQTITLAQQAEQLGYKRFLLAEHHNLEGLIGTSPEVLISHILAKTSHIRVGSAGVMLQHYSSFKVAENFHVLATRAPCRFDLGVGKTSGGLPYSTAALQRHFKQNVESFDERFAELYSYIYPTEGTLQATPIPPEPPQILLLGASEGSAAHAAKLDLNYAFARFVNPNDETLEKVANHLKHRKQGKFILSVIVYASDNGEEAKEVAAAQQIYKIHYASGQVVTLQSLELAQTFANQTDEPYDIIGYPANIIAGTPEEVKAVLDDLHTRFGVDEFIIHTPTKDAAKRIRSFELLSPAKLFNLQSVK